MINHSETPNCALLRHPQPGEEELGFVTHMWAILPIKNGTELTCFYTDGYEDIIDNFGGPKYMAAL
jgi:SET domain-containing protein